MNIFCSYIVWLNTSPSISLTANASTEYRNKEPYCNHRIQIGRESRVSKNPPKSYYNDKL